MYFLSNQELFQVHSQIEKYCTHDKLSGYNPRFSFADALDMIKFNEWRPQNFETKRHRAHHDNSDFIIAQVFFEQDRHCGQEESQW